MDQQVQRYFEMSDQTFWMYSQIQGEFGPVTLQIFAPISPLPVSLGVQEGSLSHSFLHCNCSSDDSEFFQFRLQEVAYFLQVFSMFNPQIKKDYGLSQTPQDES